MNIDFKKKDLLFKKMYHNIELYENEIVFEIFKQNQHLFTNVLVLSGAQKYRINNIQKNIEVDGIKKKSIFEELMRKNWNISLFQFDKLLRIIKYFEHTPKEVENNRYSPDPQLILHFNLLNKHFPLKISKELKDRVYAESIPNNYLKKILKTII